MPGDSRFRLQANAQVRCCTARPGAADDVAAPIERDGRSRGASHYVCPVCDDVNCGGKIKIECGNILQRRLGLWLRKLESSRDLLGRVTLLGSGELFFPRSLVC